jgi:glutamate carboxypeptidase
MPPAANLEALLTATTQKSPWITETLRDLVRIESPTESPAAVNAAMAFVAELSRTLGGRIKLHKQKHFGNIHEIRFGSPRSKQKSILLLGHLDTVWPLGTLKTMPWRAENGRLYGPGVLDMKAGVVMALAAVATLRELHINRPITLLLNSEEEIGSPVSRPVTEKLARESAAIFVLEPAQGLAYKTARKGVGHYLLHVEGIAAHSGVDFDRGHSAILELARQIQIVSAFTDPAKKRTVNCGVITGGTRSNIVAASASVEIDVRVTTAKDGLAVDKLLRRLKPIDPHCKLTLTGGINRPPMERRPGAIALYKQARKLAAQLGFPLDEAATGGGSDGNFTAALGIPTLDGMGAVGEGAHAPHESILAEHLVPRTTLLAAMLATT